MSFEENIGKLQKAKSKNPTTDWTSHLPSTSLVVVVVVVFNANCPLVGPGPIGGMPSVEVFLKDLIPYLRDFWKNHGKLRTARLKSVTGILTWRLQSSSFECYHSATGVAQLWTQKRSGTGGVLRCLSPKCIGTRFTV